MMYRFILLAILSIDVLILFYQSSTISISAHEAALLYGEFSFIQVVEQFSLFIFGNNDFALRLPMIVFHVLSALLLFNISGRYLADDKNRIWLVLIFILLPGIISSALLVDSAGFIIFALLLFIYTYYNSSPKYIYILLILFSFLDSIFLYLFFSLIIYSIYVRNKTLLTLNIILLFNSLLIYGIDSYGSPKGHLLDTIGLYSAIFTPVIFIYLFYTLYKKFLSKDIDILWFISSIPLVLSLLLSLRQNIHVEDFAPYFIVALPLSAQMFYTSYRVRLKLFRTKYKIVLLLSGIFLLINFFVVLFNRELYLVIDYPQKHFARKMHIAKELSHELKKRGISCVKANNNMAKRLKFYNIDSCDDIILIEENLEELNNEFVTISYKYRAIYKASVTNINSK